MLDNSVSVSSTLRRERDHCAPPPHGPRTGSEGVSVRFGSHVLSSISGQLAISVLPRRRDLPFSFNRVRSVQGEIHTRAELTWKGPGRLLGESRRSEAGDVVIQVPTWSLGFQPCVLPYVRAIVVRWLANRRVTLREDWYLLKKNFPD